MVRLVLLCSGQGSQHPNMFRFAPKLLPALETYLTEPYADVMGSSELLFKNQNAQVLIVAAAYSNWLALKPYVPEPIAFLGYSVGELTAFACSGAISPEKVLPLVQQRAILMETAKAKFNKALGMLSVSGVDFKTVSTYCKDYQVYIAITISENSFVIGGLRDHIEAVSHFIKEGGGYAKMLPIDIASHIPLMVEASDGFARILEATRFNEHFVPVISSLTGEKIITAANAKTTLAKQLSHPLNFENGLKVISELLPTCVLELGPGTALAKMFQYSNPAIACRSIEDFHTMQGVIDWINKF